MDARRGGRYGFGEGELTPAAAAFWHAWWNGCALKGRQNTARGKHSATPGRRNTARGRRSAPQGP